MEVSRSPAPAKLRTARVHRLLEAASTPQRSCPSAFSLACDLWLRADGDQATANMYQGYLSYKRNTYHTGCEEPSPQSSSQTSGSRFASEYANNRGAKESLDPCSA